MSDISQRPRVVLIDLSNLAWACWHPAEAAQKAGEEALAKHRVGCAVCNIGDPCPDQPKQYDAKQVLLVNVDLKFGTLTEAIHVPLAQWICVKDGRDPIRRQLLPEYKANRTKHDFDPRPMVEEHIRRKGCRFAIAPAGEADDAIAALTKVLTDQGRMNVTIVSSDKDLWQLWNPPFVDIYLTSQKRFLDRNYLGQKFPERSKTSKVPGIEAVRHVRLCKSAWGDASDAIPNVLPRLQAELTPLIKAGDGTLSDLLGRVAALGSAKLQKAVADNLERLKVNYQVVTLQDDVKVEWL
jgi:5'-3' exonuclease